MDVFPDANVGINGGGNVDNIYGTVWAKSGMDPAAT